MQMQADVSGLEVHRPVVAETTALGAAMLAGLAVSVWQSQTQLAQVWRPDTVFHPTWNERQRSEARQSWSKAIERAKQWV
jgi:glycerol kinase